MRFKHLETDSMVQSKFLKNMAMANNIWFTSDLHYSHVGQLYFHDERRKLAGISLDDLHNMPKSEIIKIYDEWLIDLWNSTVKKGDVVYHLGDFCFGNRERTEYILNKLRGKKFFIRGNHDKSLNGNECFLEGLWDIKEAKFSHEMFPFIDPNETFCCELCHYPMLAWNRRTHGTAMIHGHTHSATDKLNEDSLELRVDVGLDSELSNYQFVSLEKLYEHFRKIVKSAGCNTLQDYAEWLMAKQGFRM